MANVEIITVQLVQDWSRGLQRKYIIGIVATTASQTHIKVLRCKDYHLIELGNISQEIVYARAFCCPPAMLPLYRY